MIYGFMGDDGCDTWDDWLFAHEVDFGEGLGL